LPRGGAQQWTPQGVNLFGDGRCVWELFNLVELFDKVDNHVDVGLRELDHLLLDDDLPFPSAAFAFTFAFASLLSSRLAACGGRGDEAAVRCEKRRPSVTRIDGGFFARVCLGPLASPSPFPAPPFFAPLALAADVFSFDIAP